MFLLLHTARMLRNESVDAVYEELKNKNANWLKNLCISKALWRSPSYSYRFLYFHTSCSWNISTPFFQFYTHCINFFEHIHVCFCVLRDPSVPQQTPYIAPCRKFWAQSKPHCVSWTLWQSMGRWSFAVVFSKGFHKSHNRCWCEVIGNVRNSKTRENHHLVFFI